MLLSKQVGKSTLKKFPNPSFNSDHRKIYQGLVFRLSQSPTPVGPPKTAESRTMRDFWLVPIAIEMVLFVQTKEHKKKLIFLMPFDSPFFL